MKEQKEKKQKKSGFLKEIFYYVNPKNLSSEVKRYGYKLSPGKTILELLGGLGFALVIGNLFELHMGGMMCIALVCLLFIPYLIKCTYKLKYEQQRFSDIAEYIEHMLYSFKSTRKVLTSLSEVAHSFDAGPMKDTIEAAKEKILSSIHGDVEKEGLKIIENAYRCERVRTMHRFMLKVENLGGSFDNTIDLLLEDRSMWVDRQLIMQKDKRKKSLEVIIACGITLFICWFINNGLPENMSITDNPVYQVVATLVIIADVILSVFAYSRNSMDWLQNKTNYTSEKVMADYNIIKNWDEKKENKNMVMGLIIAGVVALVGYLSSIPVVYIGAGILGAYFVIKANTKLGSAKKRIEKEINIKFPRWLMEIALQLQIENVQNAISNSIPTAPVVLRAELEKLMMELEKNNDSVEPYLNFMKDFGIPEVTSSMRLLYSLQAGTGGDSESQITDIIRRNNVMMDKSEKLENENAVTTISTLTLITEITASVMLMVSMALFLISFLSSATSVV